MCQKSIGLFVFIIASTFFFGFSPPVFVKAALTFSVKNVFFVFESIFIVIDIYLNTIDDVGETPCFHFSFAVFSKDVVTFLSFLFRFFQASPD